MLYTLIISVVLLLFAVFILGFRVFFFSDKKFPSRHIGQNKYLKEKGITCAVSQHREAQKTKKIIIQK